MPNLIDRDVLIEKIRDDGILGNGYSDSEREDDVIDMIESCQTVDSVPVFHGKWIHRKMDIAEHPWRCSVCSWGNHHIDRYVSEFERCPNCGAKMDGGKQE